MNQGSEDTDHLLSYLKNEEREVVDLIARRTPLEKIIERMGLPQSSVESLVHRARFAFGANDDLIDDYLALLQDWQTSTGSRFATNDDEKGGSDEKARLHSRMLSILGTLQNKFSPTELRDVASSLLKLADSMEQNWSPDRVQSHFSWPSRADRIERNSLELAKRAVLLMEHRKIREKYLPGELFGDPAWNMLLDLFVQFAGGAKVSITSLCIAAYCPGTTALRYIKQLEEAGLVEREASPSDARVKLLTLTKKGVIGVGRVLERVAV